MLQVVKLSNNAKKIKYFFREGQRSSGAFRPRVRGSGVLVLRGQEEDEEGEERSPNKRHRTTPRPHNIPRPSLDFEKMQQVNFF